MKRAIGIIVVLSGMFFAIQGHFISRIWPQKELSSQEVGDSSSLQRVLIGGTASAFKSEVVQQVVDTLASEGAYVKVVGMKDLLSETPGSYSAVCIVNTCIGWGINAKVKDYIEQNHDYPAFVVFTTSGDPDSCGSAKNLPDGIDAISSASVPEKTSAAVNSILMRLRHSPRKEDTSPLK